MEAVEAFLPFLTDSKTIQRALVWSAEKGRSKLVKSILQHPGVDVNAKVRGDTALYLACQSQDRDTIFALIDAGADPTILSLGSGDEFGGVDSRGTYYTGEDDDNGTESALFALCNRGRRYQSSDDSEALQELLTLLTNKGASIDQRAPGGSTLLHAAGNDLVLLRLLLSAGVDANTTDNLGQVPLHNADRLDSVSLLIEEGSAKLDFISSHDGRTPLMRSLAGYNTEVVLKLLEHGPDVSVKDKKGDGPLHILLGNHSAKTTVLRSLLAAGADPNKLNRMGETPLLIMRLDAKESMEHLDMLLEAGADIDAKDVSGMSLLSRLMRSGPQNDCEHNDIEALLERGADRLFRDHKGRTLLHHAVAHWAAKNTHSHSPKYVSRLDYLLSIGLDPQLRDHCGNSLIHECALRSSVLDPYYGSNNITLLKQLMDLDVEISARNQYGRTVLHILAATGTRGTQLFRCGEPSLLDFVISKFANLNTGDYQGLTALHFASTVCERTTKALLDAGADPTLTSLDGLTPLHLAARAQQSNIVGLLLDSRKNATKPFTELRDMRGRSALYYACRSGTYEVVKLLLDAGADASGKEMFQACCDFEEEQALWAANRHIADTEKNQNAGGLTVEDTSRPMLSSEISWRSLDLHPTRDVVRLEEIIDLLFKHGCDTTGLRRYLRGNNPATTSVYQGHAYTFRCLVEAYERAFPDTSQSQSSDSDDEDDYYYFVGDSINAKFGKLLIESHKIAQVDAALHLADTEERQFNSSLIARLLKRREFHAIKPLFEKGVDFLTGADEAHCSCIMETFIAHGYATILGEIGTLEARRQFNKGKWYAFNDPHSPGLYIESPHEEAKAGETRQCLFLLDALARAAPNMDVVRLLVEKFHVDVNQSVSEQNTRYSVGSQSTALHYLARGLHWWHVALAMPYLISKGANLEVKDANEATPLHVALGGPEGYVGPYSGLAVTTLLDAGANLNASESNQSYLARSIWDLSMLQNLLDRGAKVDADALHATVKYKKIEALKLLLKFHADPNLRRDPVPAVSIASKKRPGHWRTRFGLPRHEIYALYTAAETFDKDNPTVAVQLMEALLDAGADPFARYSKGPYQYCNDKELDEEETVIEVLRNHKPSEDAREVLLLHELLEDGKLSFPILNSPGLNVNVRDAQGRTIAHVICHKHSLNEPIDSVEYMSDEVAPSMMPSFMDCLLQHGANLRARDNNGRNIFHHIFESYRRCKTNAQSISDLPYLLKHYASLLNQADCYGKTPLHMALRYGVYQYNFEAAEILLDAGADPSAVDKFGNSCLHIVAIAIHRGASARSMFSNLLSRGLDINARNLRGETPIFYLNRFPYSTAQPELTLEDQILAADAVRLLENAGADLFAKDNAGQGLLHIAAKTDERHRRERDYAWCFYDRRSLPRSEAYLVRFQVLVQKGLDPMMEDKQKMTALDVAAACGNVSVLQLFEKDDLGSQKVIVAEI